jgi:hypothetical protein
MIPLAVPIAFAVLALVAWRYDARARRAYEATLSGPDKRQFRALRRVHPSRWRAVMALKHAEAAVAASQEADSRQPEKTSQRRETRRRAKRDTKSKPRNRKTGRKSQRS